MSEAETLCDQLQVQLFKTENRLQLMRVVGANERLEGFLAGLVEEVVLRYQIFELKCEGNIFD